MTPQPDRTERGDVLVAALIVMSVGVLLVMPLLHFVSTRQGETLRVEAGMHAQYTQDAGIEYAIWKLASDEAYRQMLNDQQGVAHTLEMPNAVNDVVPEIEVVRNLPELWTYSIWVSDTLTINANNTKIYGDVHSNSSIVDNKNGTEVSGQVGYVDSCSTTPGLSHAQQVPRKEFPKPFVIEDFRPGGVWAEKASAEGKYHVYTGDLSLGCIQDGNTDCLPAGLYYVDGNVQLTDANLTITGTTIVAEGTITLNQTANNTGFDDPYVPGLLFFSNSTSPQAIFIDGNSNAVLDGGLVYAPNGGIEIAGNSQTTAGWFLSRTLVVSKNNLTIDNTVIAPSGGIDLGLSAPIYDIRASTALGRTVVRLEEEAQALNIVSWSLD